MDWSLFQMCPNCFVYLSVIESNNYILRIEYVGKRKKREKNKKERKKEWNEELIFVKGLN